jgi:dsDNA-binding SOS-regulon protein
MVRPVDTTGKGKAARRSSLLIEEGGTQREVDIEQFINFYTKKPKWLFEKFLLDHDKYESLLTEHNKVITEQRERIEQFEAVNPVEAPEYAELRRKFDDLKRKIKEKNAAIQKLVDEANQIHQVIVQNVLQMQQQSREASSILLSNQGESSCRSAKVTEPPTFTGTQEGDKDVVLFEFWELQV